MDISLKDGKTLYTMNLSKHTLFDAGMFIGALLRGDARHLEARSLVEAARKGDLLACTTVGILSEVYAALTWTGAKPPHSPEEAANFAEKYHLTARRVHDARHAAIAIVSGIQHVYTYDINDWNIFSTEGLTISGPESVL